MGKVEADSLPFDILLLVALNVLEEFYQPQL